jgi:hypothetical protein
MGQIQGLRLVVIALLMLTLGQSLPSRAQDVKMIGIGSSSCGFWLELRDHRKSESAEQWVLGYLSGAAMWTDFDILRNVDAFGIWRWLDEYCRTHPLEKIENGLKEFVKPKMNKDTLVRRPR